jgi:hypothetical protein
MLGHPVSAQACTSTTRPPACPVAPPPSRGLQPPPSPPMYPPCLADAGPLTLAPWLLSPRAATWPARLGCSTRLAAAPATVQCDPSRCRPSAGRQRLSLVSLPPFSAVHSCQPPSPCTTLRPRVAPYGRGAPTDPAHAHAPPPPPNKRCMASPPMAPPIFSHQSAGQALAPVVARSALMFPAAAAPHSLGHAWSLWPFCWYWLTL